MDTAQLARSAGPPRLRRGGPALRLKVRYREGVSGRSFTDARQYGFMVGPDDPQILDNTTDQGKADLQKWISVPNMDPLWPLSLSIPGWTDYDPNTVPSSCTGA